MKSSPAICYQEKTAFVEGQVAGMLHQGSWVEVGGGRGEGVGGRGFSW